MIQIDVAIILALISFIVGMILGVLLTRPQYPSYRSRRLNWVE